MSILLGLITAMYFFNIVQFLCGLLEKCLRHCQLLDTGLSDYFSRTYGVNRHSILDKVPCFDIIMSVPATRHHACYL